MATKHIVTRQFAVPRKGGGMFVATPGVPLDVPPDILKSKDFGHLFHKVDWPETEAAPESATAKPGAKRSTTRKRTTKSG